MSQFETRYITQRVVNGTKQPLTLGGIASDGSDAVVFIGSTGNVGIGGTPVNGERLQVKTGTNRNLGISDQTTITGAVTIEGIDDTRGSNIPLEVRGSTVSITRPTGTTAVFDASGNVGIGVTPSAWSTSGNIELMDSRVISIRGNINISSNGYYNNGWKAINTAEVTNWYTYNGGWFWQSAPSTAAGQTPIFSLKMQLDNNGNLLLQSGTGALGYGTGAGGTVTQLTSKSTSVTLNKPSGRITMNNAALAAGATVGFVFLNSLMGASDTLTLSIPNLITNDVNNYRVVHNLWNGGASIFVTNVSGSSLSEAISINFNVHKGALS